VRRGLDRRAPGRREVSEKRREARRWRTFIGKHAPREVVPGARRPEADPTEHILPRMRLVLALLLSVMVLFTGRLMYLQIALAEELRQRSEQNVTQQRQISPLRGRILARDGTVLADNRVAYDLMYWGGEIEGYDRLQAFLGLEPEPRPPDRSRLEERLNGAVLAWNIPDSLVPAVEERIAGQPNLYLRERIERTYPTGLAAQVIGYTSQADPERNPGYGVDDLAGVMGIEATWERELYGAAGRRLVHVDHRGAPLRYEVLVPATPGQDIVLTLDPLVQRLAEDVLAAAVEYVNVDRRRVGLPLESVARGALVAYDPRNGEILAMASTPTFDQNVFAKRPIDPAAVGTYLGDATNKPLQNRAVEAYPPASTFKLVTSQALLDGGWIGPSSRFSCTATFRLGGITFRNWATFDKGMYDVRHAIADSCNTFYWNAVATTPNALRGWGPFIEQQVALARAYGFGAPLGVGLREERSGRIPDQEWVRAQPQYEHGWLPGFTINTVIGQGDVLATPVQIAQLVGTLALEGELVQPHLVQRIGDVPTLPDVRRIESRHYRTLKEGMRMMFTDYPSRTLLGPGAFPIEVAGKTGTAQTPRGADLTHAWFMGYAPYRAPEIAIAVFIEYGGSSSRVSVPVARDFFAGYFGVGAAAR
jgi:penicillin-binding protein 2